MYLFLQSFAQLLLLLSGIIMLTNGLSKKEKFTANKKLQKSMLIYGIVIITLTLIISIPDMYNGFIDGWSSNN